MKMLVRAALMLSIATPIVAQPPGGQPVVAPSGYVPAQALCTTSATGKAVCPPALATADVNDAPFASEAAMTVGATVAATRSVKVRCTAAGTATFAMAGGGTSAWDVTVGTQTLPISVTGVTASTGTCTFSGLY